MLHDFHIDTDNFSLRLTMQPLVRTPKKVRAKIEDPIPMVQHALFLPLDILLISSGMYCVRECMCPPFIMTDLTDKYCVQLVTELFFK